MSELAPPPLADTAPDLALRQVGVVEFVQIQERSLKVEEQGRKRYDPAPLRRVARLELSDDGLIGFEGERSIMDIHHRKHPQSKSWGDAAGISLGFTSHYERMRRRFGEHVRTGCAGENIIVATELEFVAADLGPRLELRRPDGSTVARLAKVMVAAPCEPFSRFAGGPSQAPEELKATLQFLHHGTRGYYAVLDGQTGAVQPGDVLFAVIAVDTPAAI